ncbi:conserved hypothetical protein [Vibrio nigripulchritudo SOn1]|uniref:Uncharacterized protein n=1 Tax=Vibrio nigripulchritudo SOn1 TaxID=1238450 RepID=A0AAV2VKJ8_9VIBR|nr:MULTISPECIES: HAD family hydrolase [Vibrio]UAB73911.1 HAD family hydrolase [Vibrio sp. SCSIO 43132]CCO45003.1 conserved hypothetical protein [Vibrio nigripulchritudo SOn1]
MFKTIVFDMDMTLCYPTVSFEQVFEKTFNVSMASVRTEWLNKITFDGACTGLEAVEHCFPELSVTDAEKKFHELNARWALSQSLYSGVKELPQKLREKYQCRVGILTNGPSACQHAILDQFGFKDAFDFVYASGDDEIAMRKPNPKLIQALESIENIDPYSALFVGDSFEKDISPALQCGWKGIHVNPSLDSVEHVAFDTFEECANTKECLTINWRHLSDNHG